MTENGQSERFVKSISQLSNKTRNPMVDKLDIDIIREDI